VNITELRQRQAEAHEAALALTNQAEADKRDLNEDEVRDIKAFNAEFAKLDEQINLLSEIQDQSARLTGSDGRQTEPENGGRLPAKPEEGEGEEPPAKPKPAFRSNQPANRQRIDPIDTAPRGKWGWRNFGEFARAVMHGSNKANPVVDPRFTNAPTTFGSEGVGADGGFAVPPDFRTAIMEKVQGEESLLSRTDLQTIGSNRLVIPMDNTTPWQTTGGLQAYWGDEGELKTQSKPALAELSIGLHKLYCLVPVTDELLEDAPGLDGYLRRKAPEKINFKVSKSLITGTGAGQPLGVLNSAATVVVAKESGQTADTIVAQNLIKMWGAMYGPLRSGAIWLMSHDAEAALINMTFPIGVGGVPLYLPAGGLSASPYSTLFGRPVITHQAMETIGDKGDIVFGNWQQYLAVQKAGGVKADVSIHLWFDYDVTAFRFVLRVGGQPWWNAAIDQADGSNTLGAFVTLAERA
jgi:HK97 family phage major capsid protein